MTDAPAARPADRYGDLRPSWHRTAARTVTVLVAVLGLAYVVWVGIGVADRDVRWQDVGFRLDAGEDGDAGSAVEVTFDVTVYEGTTATCTVRALSASYAVVGQVDVPVEVEPDRRTVRQRATVLVTEPAVSGGVEECTVP
ncbi:hypothetical protein GCM10028777_27200 [Angustibacter speluncae]